MADNKPKSLRDDFAGSTPMTTDKPMLKWDKPGQRLRGKFIRVKEGSLSNQHILMLETADGVIQVSCPVRLQDALDGIRAGAEIVIQYDGQDKPKKEGQQGMRNFQVVQL